MSMKEKVTPQIDSYRAIVGSIIAVGWLVVYSFVWITDGNPSLFMDTITGLVVVSSLIGLYGRGAVKAASSILKSE